MSCICELLLVPLNLQGGQAQAAHKHGEVDGWQVVSMAAGLLGLNPVSDELHPGPDTTCAACAVVYETMFVLFLAIATTTPSAADGPPPSRFLQALQHENALPTVLTAAEPLDVRQLLLPASFASRLITTAQEAFAVQYVQAGGLNPPFVHKLLRVGNPSPLLIDALTIVSQLARVQPSGGCNLYEPLLKSNLLPLIRDLLGHSDAGEAGVRRAALVVGLFLTYACTWGGWVRWIRGQREAVVKVSVWPAMHNAGRGITCWCCLN